MKVPNYLHLAPSGVWFFRARVAGRIVKRSLHTRDRLTAQRQALALAWHTRGMPRKDETITLTGGVPDGEAAPPERSPFRHFEISRNASGDVLAFKTDGSEQDNKAGLAALDIIERARSRQSAEPRMPGSALRLTIAQAAKKWEGTLADHKPKTRTIKIAAITSFANHVGKAKVLDDCGRVDVGNWVDALRAGGLATPTLVNKASYLAGFFKWAAARGYYSQHKDNPARGQVAYGPRAKRARKGEGFRPFTPAHIAVLYDPAAIAKLSEAARWGAVIGLHTGARVSEVGQLRLADFVESHSVPCVHITDDAKGQSVKTDKSDRTVPIHRDLIALGLLDHVAALRAAGETRLFPRAKVGGVNGMGNWLSKAFSYHIQREGAKVEKGRLGFHSLRKTLTHRLQDAGVHPEIRAAIEGHELDDEHHMSYSRDITPAEMRTALNKVDYGLDLAGLRAALARP